MSRLGRAASFYSRWARLYAVVADRTPGIRRIRSRAVELLDVDPDATIVEMGCGPGPNVPHFRRVVGEGGAIVGIDIAMGALQRARQRALARGWERIHVVCADATRPPIVRADAIVGAFVLGMFDDPAEAVNAWCDTVGPGGRICLIDFLSSDRQYAPIPNLVLRGILLVSVPGRTRFSRGMLDLLDTRVTRGNDVVRDRCSDHHVERHWGGIVRIHVGTVDA